MARFSYTLDNGAEITVDAANMEEAAPLLEAEYNRITGAGNTGVADTLYQGLEGLTAGWIDEINAGFDAVAGRDPKEGLLGGWGDYGDNFNDRYRRALSFYRNNAKDFEADNPGIAMGAEVAGAVAPALLSGGTTAAPSLGRLATQGAVQGGLYGAGASEGDLGDMAVDTATGAALGGAVAPIAGKLLGAGKKRIDAEGVASAMKSRGDDTFNALRAQNAEVPGFRAAAAQQEAKAAGRGIGPRGDAELYEQVGFLGELAKSPERLKYQQAEDAIEGLRNAAKGTTNQTKKALATRMANELEDALPPAIKAERRAADDLWRRSSQSQALKKATDDALREAENQGLGGNVVNKLRQAVEKTLKDSRKKGYLTTAEQEAFEAFAKRGSMESMLRLLSVFDPSRSAMSLFAGGGALGAAASIGGPVGVPLATALGGAGYTARRAGEKLTMDNIDNLQRMLLGVAPDTMGAGAAKLGPRLGGLAGGSTADVSPQSLLEYLK